MTKTIKRKYYFIQPLNEGQELNYHETFYGNIQQATERTKIMVRELQHTLKDGSIMAEILDKDGKKLKEVI